MIARKTIASLSVTGALLVPMAADCKGNSRPCPDGPEGQAERLNNECTPTAAGTGSIFGPDGEVRL